MNPQVKDFLKTKDLTMFGLVWAIYWRLFVLACAVGFAIGVIGAILD